MSICSNHNMTVMRKEADLKMTPWMTSFYETSVLIVSHLTQNMVHHNQQLVHCANLYTVQVWTLVQILSAVKRFAKFVNTKSGVRFKAR
jgi:hypothetical protein